MAEEEEEEQSDGEFCVRTTAAATGREVLAGKAAVRVQLHQQLRMDEQRRIITFASSFFFAR
jgi:hypothetical protein